MRLSQPKNIVFLFLIISIMAGQAGAEIVSVGTFGGTVASAARDQDNGWIYGFEAKIKLVRYVYFRPSAAFGRLGDVSYDFGSREGSNLRIYRFDFVFGKFPKKKYTFGGGMILGLGYVYLSRQYDRDLRERVGVIGGSINYKILDSLDLELSGCLYTRGFGHVTGDARLGINYTIDFERLFHGK